ncbi:hypothetical protein LZ554_007874 [Drepanopeziza brunnea f. sp. 'monogermtubi']|nr:hypothetical protein LZ554_007874 [Drepanopeziza brunnea f. sp. 'monogermtubi']
MAARPSNNSSPNPIRISQDSMTYGVELEYVFAFKEDLIQFTPFRGNPHGRTLVKDLPYATRAEERFSRCSPRFVPNRIYNSWGVQTEEPPRDGHALNPYAVEPLRVVEAILRKGVPALQEEQGAARGMAGRTVRVMNTLLPAEKQQLNWENQMQWKVTKDHSVCGVGSGNISNWLPGKVACGNDSWDSIGVEIISPVLDSGKSADKDRIRDIIEAMKGDTTAGAFVTNQCGLHVHVGGPTADDFGHLERAAAEKHASDIKKELAIILLVYEYEIARLHPPCRHPGHANAAYQFSSNRLGLIKDRLVKFPGELINDSVDTSLRSCIDVDCSTRAASEVASIPAIRSAMERATVENMVHLMHWPAVYDKFQEKPNRQNGDKDRQVNLTYLLRDSSLPRTIEFRQARGSLDAGDVSRWVDFCIGLVRLARLYVDDPPRFRVDDWGVTWHADGTHRFSRISVFDLIRDMDLGYGAEEYWENRIAKFALYEDGDETDRLDDEEPPAGFMSTQGGTNPLRYTPSLRGGGGGGGGRLDPYTIAPSMRGGAGLSRKREGDNQEGSGSKKCRREGSPLL